MDFSLVDFGAFAMIIMLLTLTFVIRILLLRRAMFQVISILRDHNSVSHENAKTIEELGLKPPTFRDRFRKPKDYKILALKTLIQMDAVQITEDQKICLVEENLVEGLR